MSDQLLVFLWCLSAPIVVWAAWVSWDKAMAYYRWGRVLYLGWRVEQRMRKVGASDADLIALREVTKVMSDRCRAIAKGEDE